MRALRMGKRTAAWLVNANNNNVCQFNVAHRIALKTALFKSIYSQCENFGLLNRPQVQAASALEYDISLDVAVKNTR